MTKDLGCRSSMNFSRGDKEQPLLHDFLLTIMTGIRKGEILGTAWRYLNIEVGYLIIAQTLNKKAKLVPRTKTKAGFCSIDLPDEVIKALIKHKEFMICIN